MCARVAEVPCRVLFSSAYDVRNAPTERRMFDLRSGERLHAEAVVAP